MPSFLPDTSCLVPTVCGWHEHHAAAAGEIEGRLARDEHMILAGPALVEAYAVLTRLPAPYRLAPSDALAILEASFVQLGKTIALDARGYRRLLHDAPAEGLAGGRLYDAVIAHCALVGKATTLLTFNDRHFESFTGRGLTIVVPSARAR